MISLRHLSSSGSCTYTCYNPSFHTSTSMPPFASFRSKPLAWKSIVVSHPFSHHPSRSIPRSISQPVPGRSTFSNNCVIEFRSHRSPPKTFARAMPPSGDVRQGGDDAPPKTRVLFVCLGNICRSPTAEAVFRAVVERNGLGDRFDIASCGTGGGSSNWYKVRTPLTSLIPFFVLETLSLQATFSVLS